MGMEKVIENFIAYMREAKKASQNTEISYERDLKNWPDIFVIRRLWIFRSYQDGSTRLSEGIAEGESGIIYNFQKYCINKSTVSLYDKNRENAGRSV